MGAVATATAAEPPGFNVLLLGDTYFGESYHDRLASEGRDPVLRTRGREYFIANFTEILASADYTVMNLETPATDRFPSPYADQKDYLHYADPDATPRMLARYGVDLASLGNNHAFDYGRAWP